MRWYARLRPTAIALVGLLLCACGALPGSAPAAAPTSPPPPPPSSSSPAAAASPSPSPAAAASPTTPAAAPQATNTSAPAASASTVYVGNTDGEGVYIRNTPVMEDKNQAYPDGTALTIIGDDVEGDGQHWKHVKAPDGTEGFVPSMYTTTTPP